MEGFFCITILRILDIEGLFFGILQYGTSVKLKQ